MIASEHFQRLTCYIHTCVIFANKGFKYYVSQHAVYLGASDYFLHI